MASYVKESDIEMEIGNYKDCIANMVRGVQRYFNELYDYIPMLYPDVISQKSKYLPLVMFLFSESDNIIKQKGISFVIDGLNLINRKFDSLSSVIENNKNYDMYLAPKQSLEEVYTSEVFSKFVDYSFNEGKSMLDDYNKEYDLETYCDIVTQELRTKYSEIGKREVTKDELLKTLVEDFKYLPEVMTYLRELSETSSSVYATSQVLKIMISSLVLGFVAMENIEPINKK